MRVASQAFTAQGPGRNAGALRRARCGAVVVLLALGALAPSRAAAAPLPAGAEPMPHLTGDDAHARAERARRPDDDGISAPASLDDLSAWLDYKSRSRLGALPIEARVFFRRGLLLHARGESSEALRLVRGAAELDPGDVAPHLTLASWFLVSEPGQALQQFASALELMRQSFALQLAITANGLVLVLQSLFLALLAAGLLMVGMHQAKIRHVWKERLVRWLSPRSSELWAWALLVLPFVAGFGLALPTVASLGVLWPNLRARERSVFVLLAVALVGVPWVSFGLDRLTGPMQQDRAPFYGVPLLQNAPDLDGERARVDRLAAENPDNPYLQFASGWLARRDGDLRAAEAGYRRTLALWPRDDRVLNDLSNLLAAQGRVDEALAGYQQAIAVAPENAAAHFNASQIHTLRFDYHDATDELSRASALNFDLVKTYQSQAGADGWLPLADQWIAPAACWRSMAGVPAGDGAGPLPPAWRSSIECSGWPFSVVAALIAILSAIAGSWLQRSIPLRTCSNCGRTVCRRCAARRRERALCPSCAALDSRAESPEFARVLLLQQRRRLQRRSGAVRAVLATAIPGYGLLAFRAVFAPLLLLTGLAALATVAAGVTPPFASEPRILLPGPALPMPVMWVSWIVLYALSIGGYLAYSARERERAAILAKPVRTRTAQPTHTTRAAA